MNTSAPDECVRSMIGMHRTEPLQYSSSMKLYVSSGCDGPSAFDAGRVRDLLSRGDVQSLKIAKSVTKCIAIHQAKAQIAVQQSAADRYNSLSANGPSAAHGVQTSQQPLRTAEAQCQRDDTDQLWCKLISLRGDVDSKEAELAALLTCSVGLQQPITSCHRKRWASGTIKLHIPHATFVTSKACHRQLAGLQQLR